MSKKEEFMKKFVVRSDTPAGAMFGVPRKYLNMDRVWQWIEEELKQARIAAVNQAGSDVSDGYHTFNELYEHRHMLFMNLLQLKWDLNHDDAWKSKVHNDGSSYEGWFIAGMDALKGKPITYHMPMEYYDLCPGNELDKAPEWDGHTSADVIKRLKDYLEYQKAH